MNSVVIVTKATRPRNLQSCLDALAKQSFKDFEVVLVTPCDVALNSPSVNGLNVHIVQQNGVGVSNARNSGIQACKGNIVVFTDDDAEPYPDWLEKINGCFTEHPELAYVGGEFTLEPKNIWQRWINSRYRLSQVDVDRGLCHGNNMAYRRSVFDNHLFDEGIIFGAEESEFQTRLRQHGIRGQTFSDILVKHQHRIGFASFTKMRWEYAQGKVYVQEVKHDTELFHWRDLMNMAFIGSLAYAVMLAGSNPAFWLFPISLFALTVFHKRKRNSSLGIWLVDVYAGFLWTLSKMYYSFKWHLKRWGLLHS